MHITYLLPKHKKFMLSQHVINEITFYNAIEYICVTEYAVDKENIKPNQGKYNTQGGSKVDYYSVTV